MVMRIPSKPSAMTGLLRPLRGGVVLTLAVCLAGAESGLAASNRFAEFPTAAAFAPGAARDSGDVRTASFNERFYGLKISVASITPIDLLPIVPQAMQPTATPLPRKRVASLHPTGDIVSRPPRQKIVAAGKTIVGIASTYNPGDPKDMDAGNIELSSGERYDPNGWTAAIQTKLRYKFGGVRFGKNYQPFYALVQANDKQLIVKINDVGPLRRGRIIDLNVRAMRYFDPTLDLGLIGNVKVTPLAGQQYALGPIEDNLPVAVASRTDQKTR